MLSPSFKLPPSGLKLKADEIHIWFGILDQPVYEFRRFIQTLDRDERTRAGLFHFQKDRKRFIARHGILRMILGRYLGVKPSEVRFYRGKNGKPALTETFGKETIRFNLSHSDSVALFAFSRNHEIGVDIEQIRDIPEMDHIVELSFCPREKAFFRALPQGNRRDAFFDYWTRKEAYIKATGEGLSQALDRVDVTFVPREAAKLVRIEGDSIRASRWSIQELKPVFGFAAAFAVEGQGSRLHCWQWSGQSI